VTVQWPAQMTSSHRPPVTPAATIGTVCRSLPGASKSSVPARRMLPQSSASQPAPARAHCSRNICHLPRRSHGRPDMLHSSLIRTRAHRLPCRCFMMMMCSYLGPEGAEEALWQDPTTGCCPLTMHTHRRVLQGLTDHRPMRSHSVGPPPHHLVQTFKPPQTRGHCRWR